MDPRTVEYEVWNRVLGKNSCKCSEVDAQQVQEMLSSALADAERFCMLSSRLNGRCREILQRAAARIRSSTRQLETVYYLMSGQCPALCPTDRPALCSDCCAALRALYLCEQDAAAALQNAAEHTTRYKELFCQLAKTRAANAEQLRCVLQSLL